MEDFANEKAMQRFVLACQTTFTRLRDDYVEIQDDVSEGWTSSNTLAYIGLGMLAPSKPTKLPVGARDELANKSFAELYDISKLLRKMTDMEQTRPRYYDLAGNVRVDLC